MIDVACGYCGNVFPYNPTRPNKKYCQTSCQNAAKRKSQSNTEKNAARDAKRKEHVTEFVAVDGEGIDGSEITEEWDEQLAQWVMIRRRTHDYVLISVGDKSYHRNGAKLNHEEIFTFLYSCFLLKPNAAYVGFFLGYDFAQWFQSLPASRGIALFDKQAVIKRMPRNPLAREPFPVDYKGWQFDILANKRFKLRPHVRRSDYPKCQVAHKLPTLIEECTSGKHNRHPDKWMFVCDAGGFFQTALMNAINPAKWKPGTEIVTPEELTILQTGKDKRGEQTVFGEELIQYNVLENEVLARLMDTVNKGFVADGIRLKVNQWFGPGQAAQRWMRNIGLPTGNEIREVVPKWASDAARESYFGGWFEIMMHGIVSGTTYSYDINSAYPFAIANLPCLLHGKWSNGEGKPERLPKNAVQLIDARVVGRNPFIGAMPHRDSAGRIVRPQKTSGWYWQHELDAARKAGLLATASVDRWVRYEPCDCLPPAAAIAELYLGRLLAGKDTPYGMSKKLVYNSAYGKFAQSVGSPVFSNSVYASLITARCRTMILEAISTHPQKAEAVAMVATDSVTFLTPHPTLDVDKEALGKWGYSEYQNLSLMMPGLYWHDESRNAVKAGMTPKLKSRGVSAKDLGQFIDVIDRQWQWLMDNVTDDDNGWWPDDCPKVDINVAFSLISPKLAVARTNWLDCGRVRWDTGRTLSANPEAKRSALMVVETLGKTVARSGVYEQINGEVRSIPYDKAFGDDATVSDLREFDEWVTPDGNVHLELVKKLHSK